MDANLLKRSAYALALVLVCRLGLGATFTTTNFVVTAPNDEIAKQVANCAEFWRRDLAIQWLGEPLKNWYRPCTISVKVGQIGAGGSTTFTFENGEVFGWRMEVQGSLERILDSVIPHEVNHTIFASHFRRPLPRWADEGAATLVEHESERARQVRLLEQVVDTNRRIPLKQLLSIREYPRETQQVLTLYAEGYSLAEFLVGRKGDQGRSIFLKFLDDAHRQGWERAFQKHYGFSSLDKLEQDWTGWILAGSPSFDQHSDGTLLADSSSQVNANEAPHAGSNRQPGGEEVVIRSQTPDDAAPLPMIPRQLRTERTGGGFTDGSDVRRTAESTTGSRAGDGIRSDVEDYRPRDGDRREIRPSLPPATLSPTADGIFTDPNSRSYGFPEARR